MCQRVKEQGRSLVAATEAAGISKRRAGEEHNVEVLAYRIARSWLGGDVPVYPAAEPPTRSRSGSAAMVRRAQTAKAGERAGALSTAIAARDELKDRLELKRLLPIIEAHVASARWAQQAAQLERRFTVLLRSLTETAKTRASSF